MNTTDSQRDFFITLADKQLDKKAMKKAGWRRSFFAEKTAAVQRI